MKSFSIFCWLLFAGVSSLMAQPFTSIPDANFEQALIDLEIDTDATINGQVATVDIDTIEQLNVSGYNIVDLTGIEDFASLTNLNCSFNRLGELDISALQDLTALICSSNQLDTLDLGQNDTLKFLDCSNNQLTNLDVSNNQLLENLTCSANQLTSLDVSQNDSLLLLSISNNQLTQIELSNNKKLTTLICASNQLKFLNVVGNELLTSLDFSNNLIITQSLVSNTALTSVNCSNNLLQFLDIRNMTNEVLDVFYARENPFLSCINVDDINQTGDNWEKDAGTIYSVNCNPPKTYVPDDNFEDALIALGLDSAPRDDSVVTDNIRFIPALNISNQAINDLTGIQDFTSLTFLDCSNNNIVMIDLTKNVSLVNLDCSSNNLISLNLKNGNNLALDTNNAQNNQGTLCIAIDDDFNPTPGWQKDASASYDFNCNPGETFVPDDNFEQALIDMGLDAGPLDNYVSTTNINSITALDVSSKFIADLTGIEDFIALESLDCSSNLLNKLDIDDNTSLTNLQCYSNYLSELNISENDALEVINCGDNLLGELIVTDKTNLEVLIFDSNNLTGIDLSGNANLLHLNCNSNKMTREGLDLSANINLEELLCSNNKFDSLDIDQNPELMFLDCSSNSINELVLIVNPKLTYVNCSQNVITDLILTSNNDLDTLICNSNLLEELILTSNDKLRMLNAEDNLIDAINLTNSDSLRFLNVASNELSNLNVNGNEKLVFLNCNDNQLEELSVDNNIDLEFLSFNNNLLDSINIDQNLLLQILEGDNNELLYLTTYNNINLEKISVPNNSIDSLNVITNINLGELNCSGNELNVLDVSYQHKLTSLNCSSNMLTRLIIKNGRNDTLSTLNALNNPDLFCIEVDDPGNIGDDWQKDAVAYYNDNCRYDDTYVPDDNFESALAVITGEPDNNDNYILTSSINSLTSLDVSNGSIEDLTGIEDFTALQSLNISDNSIDSVFLSENKELINLYATNNQLDEIDLLTNGMLEVLDVANNSFTFLNLDSLTGLTDLNCSGNSITELDLRIHTVLTSLNCSSNQLEFLNVQNENNGNLETFDASGNPNLTCIEVDDTNAIGGGWIKDDIAEYSENCHYRETYVPDDAFEQALIEFGFDYSGSGPLDDYVPTSKIQNITNLNIRDRDIADLTGIEDFVSLTSLNCSNNLLTNIDLSANVNLNTLNCESNQLMGLEILSNSSLSTLNASNNFIPILDITQNVNLIRLDVSSNQLTSLDILQNQDIVEIFAHNNLLITVDANNGFNDSILTFDLRNNPSLTCILVDDIAAANGYFGWNKDAQSFYKLICDDDDNDGIADVDDLCPTTPIGNQVDLFGCSIFNLPQSNFTILTTSESCRAGNNGLINISVLEVHPYVATLIGRHDTVDYEFFDKVEIRNVRADTYQLCIRVIGEPGYLQCYTVEITEPEDLKVIPARISDNGRVAYQLSGSSSYIIEFNGLVFTTTESLVELTLEKGPNNIKIKTDAECQGVFEEVIHLTEDARLFPNPFNNLLQIIPGDRQLNELKVNIFTISGTLLKTGNYQIERGTLNIDTSWLEKGIYLIDVTGIDYHSTFKAVKQ